MNKLFKKIISLILLSSFLLQLSGCSAIKETTDDVKNSVIDWYEKIDLAAFQRGWDQAVDFLSSSYGALVGSEYIQDDANAINQLKGKINESVGSSRGIAQEAGFVAEKWAAQTFNIDAAIRRTGESAKTNGSTELGSADVSTNYGENASLKYYSEASESAQEQARNILLKYSEYKNKAKNPKSLEDYLNEKGYDPSDEDMLMASIYNGQTRIIPSDQLKIAKDYLQGKIDDLLIDGADPNNPKVAALYETLESLRDRLRSPKGASSKPATYEEMQAITELAIDGDFSPEDFGYTLSQIIPTKYIVKQAIGAGINSALIQTVLSIGPDLFSILSEAYKSGEFNDVTLKELGIDALFAGSEGFIEGSISCLLIELSNAGKLGSAFKNISADIIATLVVLILDSIRYGYYLSQNTITSMDYSNLIAEEIVVSVCSITGETLLKKLFPLIPFAYLAGSFAGAICGSVGYRLIKELILELKDCDGFAAFFSKGTSGAISLGVDQIADIHMTNQLSTCGDMIISTSNEGFIIIQGNNQ